MQMQVEAERRKRAAILESEGQREADINIAEGKRQAKILQSGKSLLNQAYPASFVYSTFKYTCRGWTTRANQQSYRRS